MEMRDTALSTAGSKRCAGSGKESLLRLKQLKNRPRIEGPPRNKKPLAPRCRRKDCGVITQLLRISLNSFEEGIDTL